MITFTSTGILLYTESVQITVFGLGRGRTEFKKNLSLPQEKKVSWGRHAYKQNETQVITEMLQKQYISYVGAFDHPGESFTWIQKVNKGRKER